MTDRENSPLRRAVSGCVREYVRQHGFKRGIHLAAEAIGVSARVARHAYEGTPFAADDDRAARADAARLALLNDTIAQLCATRDQIERDRHVAVNARAVGSDDCLHPRPRGRTMANVGQCMDGAVSALLTAGNRMLREGDKCQPMRGKAA